MTQFDFLVECHVSFFVLALWEIPQCDWSDGQAVGDRSRCGADQGGKLHDRWRGGSAQAPTARRDSESCAVVRPRMAEDGPAVFEHACWLGVEGIVSKRVDGSRAAGLARR